MQREAGFTLVEVMVALTLFALLSTAMYSLLHLAARGWETAAVHAGEQDDFRHAQRFLRQWLASALPVSRQETDGAHSLFAGKAHELVMAADLQPELGEGGLHEFRIATRRHAGKRQLIVTRTPVHQDKSETKDPAQAESVLVDDLAALEISYYGRMRGEKAARWHATWLKQPMLPRLVRFRARQRQSGQWPELVVALRAEVPILITPAEDPSQISGPSRSGNGRARPRST